MTAPRIAVIVPCLDEALTVAKVVADFRAALPEAEVFVYDNGSTDGTATLAREAGATVRTEKRKGKGFVVARMLDEVDADLLVMVDGDDTYPAEDVRALLAPALAGTADMVVGNRLRSFAEGSFRPAHEWGNKALVAAINLVFGSRLEDVMSGYRVMTRDLAGRVPVVSRGFEIETELTLRSLQRGFVITEVPVGYRGRPEGSFSKLHTLRDGVRVLVTIVDVWKAYRPLLFFFLVGTAVALVGAARGAVPLLEATRGATVTHPLLALVAASMQVVAVVLVVGGLVLDGLNHRLAEVEHAVTRRLRRPQEPR